MKWQLVHNKYPDVLQGIRYAHIYESTGIEYEMYQPHIFY